VTDPPVPLYEAPAERPPLVYAPWTDDQLASLRGFQTCGYWHPFTCGRCGSLLYPETNGWHCAGDDYAQNWAHEFMTDWSWNRRGDPLS
jgi:hypothetical protein